MEAAIKIGKPNKAAGADGTNVEMLQVDPKWSAKLLTSWWATIEKTGQFSREREEGIIFPLHKNSSQKDTANYRPVCLLSHMLKVVDTAVLLFLKEQFSPEHSPFVFQHGIAVTKVQLQAEYNAVQRMNHAAVLYLEKAYYKVDRIELLNLMRGWADVLTVEMIRAMLRKMRIRVRNALLTIFRA